MCQDLAAGSVTFGQMLAQVDAELDRDRRKVMSFVLRQLMDASDYGVDDNACLLSSACLPETINKYQALPQVMALSYGTKSNRRSILKKISIMFEALIEQGLSSLDRETNPYRDAVERYEKALRSSNVADLALSPIPSTLRQVQSVANRLEVASECLLEHLRYLMWKPELHLDLENPSYRWGKRMSELMKLPYALSHIPSEVEKAIGSFLHWRLISTPSRLHVTYLDGTSHELKRSGGWSYGDKDDRDAPPQGEILFRDMLRQFFGFASLPQDAEEARARGALNPDDKRLWGLGIAQSDLRLTHFLLAIISRRIVTFNKSDLESLITEV